jgi:type IV secretion system protein TrbL
MTPGVLDDILFRYMLALQGPHRMMMQIAQDLLVELALLHVVVGAFRLMVSRGVADRVLVAIVWETFVIGIFLAILLYAGEIVPAIINSFVQAGQVASNLPRLSPSTVLDQGLLLAGNLLKNMFGWGLVTSLGLSGVVGVIAGIVLFTAFALAAAYLLVVSVEGYFLIGVGVIMLGFAGLGWTRRIAAHYLTQAIGVGTKLFTLYVILGVATAISSSWAPALANAGWFSVEVYLIVLGGALSLLLVVWLIPQFAASMVTGGLDLTFGTLLAPTQVVAAAVPPPFDKAQAAGRGVMQAAQTVSAAAGRGRSAYREAGGG